MSKNKKTSGNRKKKKAGQGTALHVLLPVLALVTLILLGVLVYSFAYAVFDQEAVDEAADAQEIEIVIEDGMSVREIGALLKEKGLISESVTVFWFQELLSDYHGEIVPGTYTLSTSMTVDEMLPVLAAADQEEEEA